MKAKGPGQSALLLLDIIGALQKRRISYAIVGAFAASFYGVVRASMDADAVISLQTGETDVTTLLGDLRRHPLKVVYRKGDWKDPIGAVINVEDNFGNRVDLLMSIRGMSEGLFARTVEAKFMEARIRLVGIEDFIAMKVFAASPKDLNDAMGVLKISYDRVNLMLLKELALKYGKPALRQLQSLLKDAGLSAV